MSEQEAAGGPDAGVVTGLLTAVERHLLGGEADLTRHEVAEQAGLPLDEARALWRALGFASGDDDSRSFVGADVDALRKVARLKELAGVDDDIVRAMTRIIGQTFARLASWQGQMTMDIVANTPSLLGDPASSVGPDRVGILHLTDELMPLVGELQTYVWRRQLAAFFARAAAASTSSAAGSRMAVGFVDMADFTAFTRRSTEHELRAVLGSFESLATDVVGGCHGQIVKTIGDEVLFVADDAAAGAEIALTLVEAGGANLPQLRAGVAFGDVVSRLGDVYGQTVNIASRLTSVARTASVLVDEGMSAELRDDPRFSVKPLRPVSVRGYHHLRGHRLRRADGERGAGTLLGR